MRRNGRSHAAETAVHVGDMTLERVTPFTPKGVAMCPKGCSYML
ncbi:hypothetical protein [Bacteroides oleiciplenus]|nr:hypothetical protein [Bacteroides oleiciplenus]